MPGRGGDRGSVALETIVASVLFSVLMVAMSGLLEGASRYVIRHRKIDIAARKVLSAKDRLQRLLHGLGQDQFLAVSESEVRVLKAQEVDEQGIAVYGPALDGSAGSPMGIYWRCSPSELEDGQDNDQNGLVDEGALVFDNGRGAEVVIVTGVPAGGFKVWTDADGVISYSLVVEVPSAGKGGDRVSQTLVGSFPRSGGGAAAQDAEAP